MNRELGLYIVGGIIVFFAILSFIDGSFFKETKTVWRRGPFRDGFKFGLGTFGMFGSGGGWWRGRRR